MHFEGNQSGTIERKRVGDPPGYQPSIARDAVSRQSSPYIKFLDKRMCCRPFAIEFSACLMGAPRERISGTVSFNKGCSLLWQVSTSVSNTKELEQLEAKQAALYGRAQSVFKNVGFMCFMMWMSGSQIHLFSIMMTVSGIYQPLMAIMNSRQSKLSCSVRLHAALQDCMSLHTRQLGFRQYNHLQAYPQHVLVDGSCLQLSAIQDSL